MHLFTATSQTATKVIGKSYINTDMHTLIDIHTQNIKKHIHTDTYMTSQRLGENVQNVALSDKGLTFRKYKQPLHLNET